MSVRDEILALKACIQDLVIGQDEIVDRLIVGLLANGNLLVEGLSGLAKTRAVQALAGHIEGRFGRIQFTPDLTRADMCGREDYVEVDGARKFTFIEGPIFANIVLADEINRAPAKVQSAMLEAMEEHQVSAGGLAHKLPDLFMVIATMNPSDQEGTNALPEAQLDRFLMHVNVDYPDENTETNVIRLIRAEERRRARKAGNLDAGEKDADTGAVRNEEPAFRLPQQTIFEARAEIHDIDVPPEIEKYMVSIVHHTRHSERINYEIKSFIRLGASPRGALALDRCARAHAWLEGRTAVTDADVRAIALNVLRHRVLLTERADKHNTKSDELIEDIIAAIHV